MKKHLFPLLKGLLMTALATSGLILVGTALAIIVGAAGGNAGIPMYIAMFISYPVAFYVMHARRQGDAFLKTLTEDSYRFLDDMKSYLRGEGKYLLTIYLILAVLTVSFANSENLHAIAFALQTVFPLGLILPYPVWPTVLSLLLTSVLSLLLTALGHYRAWHYWYVNGGTELTDRELQNARNRRITYYNKSNQNKQ